MNWNPGLTSLPAGRAFLICLILAVVTLAAYWPVLGCGFLNYDDDVYVTENQNVNKGLSLTSAVWAFTTFDFSGTKIGHWQPITWLSHMLDCQLYGLDPAGHHLTNLLFHVANTLLLFWVLRNMTLAIWPSAFVAVLFALHPLHVESVAWITERRDMLSVFFWLLTMAAYNRYVRQSKVSNYLFVVLTFTMSLMSKSMSVTLPFVLLLLDYWPLSRFQFNKESTKQILHLIIEKIPLFILSGVSCIITLFASKHALPEVAFSLSFRIFNALTSYLAYLNKMIYPRNLAVLYPNLGVSLPVWQVSISFIILILITATVIYWAKKKRFLVVGWLWYLGTLVPVIGFIQIGPQVMADKYTYLPLTGIFIIIAWTAGDFCHRRRALRFVAGWVAILLVAAMFAGTRNQLQYWKDSISLCSHAIKVTENNVIMRINLGNASIDAGQWDEAIVQYRHLLQVNPDNTNVCINLGYALLKTGQLDEAIMHFRHVLQIDPDNADAYNNLGLALSKTGSLNEAIIHYRRGLQIDPNNVKIYNNLGLALSKTSSLNEAIIHYRRGLQIDPENAKIHYNLGNVLSETGQFDEAIIHYRRVLEIAPDFVNVHYHLGIALDSVSQREEAIKHFRHALLANPDDARSHYHLGNLLADQGHLSESISHYRRMIELQPEFPEGLNNLAWTLATVSNPALRNPPEAIQLAQKACELTEYQNPSMMHTLAVAYAAAGRTDKSISTVEKAMALARSKGNENLLLKLREEMKRLQESSAVIGNPP